MWTVCVALRLCTSVTNVYCNQRGLVGGQDRLWPFYGSTNTQFAGVNNITDMPCLAASLSLPCPNPTCWERKLLICAVKFTSFFCSSPFHGLHWAGGDVVSCHYVTQVWKVSNMMTLNIMLKSHDVNWPISAKQLLTRADSCKQCMTDCNNQNQRPVWCATVWSA